MLILKDRQKQTKLVQMISIKTKETLLAGTLAEQTEVQILLKTAGILKREIVMHQHRDFKKHANHCSNETKTTSRAESLNQSVSVEHIECPYIGN